VRPMEDPDERAALAVLDELGRIEGPDETSVAATEDEVEEVLRRIYAETVGLLPCALDPVAPDPALRGRVLAATVGDETQEIEPLRPPTPAPAAPAAFAAVRRGGRSNRRRRASRIALLAAGLLLPVAALGLWVAYLDSELRASRARLAWAEEEWKGEALAARAALAQIESRLATVTARR
jgi:hypothetical protein